MKILDRKLGVVVRGARIPVAEHVGDRLEGMSLSEKVDRERMADEAGTPVARPNACLLQVAEDEVAHDASPTECSMRRIATEEHLGGRRTRSSAAKISDDRFSDLAGKREIEWPPIFRSAEPDGLAPPVDVLESERHHFARANPISEENRKDCPVAKAAGRPRISDPGQAAEGLPWQGTREALECIKPRKNHAPRKIMVEHTLPIQMRQQGAYHRANEPHRLPRIGSACRNQERIYVGGLEACKARRRAITLEVEKKLV